MKPPPPHLHCRLLQKFPAAGGFSLRLNKFTLCLLAVTCLLSIFVTAVEGGLFCRTEHVGCDMTNGDGFMHKGVKRYSCLTSAEVDGNIPDRYLSRQHYCKAKHPSIEGLDFSWGACVQGSGCFDENEEPKEFIDEEEFSGRFCKVQDLPCVFPFTYQGIKYNECANMPASTPEILSDKKWR